eukprot:48030_1
MIPFVCVLLALNMQFIISSAAPLPKSKSGSKSVSGSKDSSSEDCSSNDWEVEYISSTARFQVYNPCNSDQFFKVEMTSLIEYNSNNTATSNAITSFNSIDGIWNNNDIGDDNEYEGNIVLSNVFSAQNIITEGVNFVLETLFFVENGNIYNKSIPITQYSLKWNVDISDWPFLNVNNTLRLCINTTTNNAERGIKDSSSSERSDKRTSHSSDSKDNNYKNKMNAWNIGDFELQTLDYAECDGAQISQISVNVKDQKNGDIYERNICFDFDYCEGTIIYDPILSYNMNSASNSGLTMGGKVAIGFSVAIVLLIIFVVIFYCVYRKKCGKYQGLLDK